METTIMNTLFCPLCDEIFKVSLTALEDDPEAGDCPICGNPETDTRYDEGD